MEERFSVSQLRSLQGYRVILLTSFEGSQTWLYTNIWTRILCIPKDFEYPSNWLNIRISTCEELYFQEQTWGVNIVCVSFEELTIFLLDIIHWMY